LFVAAVAILRPRSLGIEPREIPWLLAFGVFGLAFVQFLYFVGITRLDVGIALVLQYLAPVWVALYARFFVHERVRRRLWYGLALALTGLGVATELWRGGALDGIGVLACLAASFAYACYILLAERGLRRGRDVLSLLAWGFVFATLFWTVVQPWWSLPTGLLDDDVSLLGRLSGTSVPLWLLLLAVIVLGTFIPFILMIGALHHIPATRVTVTAMIEPVIAAVVAFAWLEEALGPAQIAGGVLVLGGVALAQTARAT
jgi:drug/metabolite transporter (DMT)-like permease